MGSFRRYSSTETIGGRTDETAPILKVDANTLRAQASKYRRLACALVDPRVISEVEACATELEAEAASIEGDAALGVPQPFNPNPYRVMMRQV